MRSCGRGRDDCAGRGAIQQPDEPAIGGAHPLRGQATAGIFQDLVYRPSFVLAADQKLHASGVVQNRVGEGDTEGLELLHPVGNHQPRLHLQTRGTREQGSGVPVGPHPEMDQIEAGTLAGFEGEKLLQGLLVGAGGKVGVFFLGTNAVDVCRGTGTLESKASFAMR